MLAIHNADLMHAMQQKDKLTTKIADMRVQLTACESKAHYTDEVKRESMMFCQQMIRFFQHQLEERIAVIEEKKQIINQYEQKLEEHSCSISSMEGRALATEKDLAVLHKELEQQKEKTTVAMHEVQINQDATEQLYKNYQELKANEESRKF